MPSRISNVALFMILVTAVTFYISLRPHVEYCVTHVSSAILHVKVGYVQFHCCQHNPGTV